MGVDPATAGSIGLSVDIAVPFGVASMLGAARLSVIRAGHISLIQHEATGTSRIGGHTMVKHVGRTEAQLRARLIAEPWIDAASSFTNLRTAENAISKIMRMNVSQIKLWASASPHTPLRIVQDVGSQPGYGVIRATGQLVKLSKVKIILKYETYNGKPYYILTSYLEH